MRHSPFISAVLFLLLFATPALAEKRVALVIGNGTYANAPKLPNPKNDAEDIAAALKRTGFETIMGIDLDKSGMDNAAIRFARAARDADVAVFYYSGHAMQFAGLNYLMPIDAKLADEADLRLMVRTDSIVADLQQAKNLRIFVLDSCRDNPIAEELKRSIGRTRAAGISRGLAKIDTPEGTIVAYATQSGRTAEDGTGRNSPYTSAFLKYIEQPEEIGTIFRRISADVYETTKRTQLPELSLSLIGEFYLKGRLPELPPASSNSELAALREQLRLMQEQISRREPAVLAPPSAVPVVPQPSRPAGTNVAPPRDPFGFPPPPEPAPVELGERAAASRVDARSPENQLIELGGQAARPQQQAGRDPFNLPPPPEPAPVQLGAPSVRPQESPRVAARDPYNLPPPPVPAPVELGAQAGAKRNDSPLPPEPLVELGQQAALRQQPLQSSAASGPASLLRHLRDIKGPFGQPRGYGSPRVFAQWDGRTIVALGADSEFRRWDSDTGAMRETARLDWGNGGLDRMVLSSAGYRLAFAKFTDTHVYASAVVPGIAGLRPIWKDTNKDRAGCTGDAIAFSPDGQILAKAYPVSSIRLYDAANGKVIRTLPAPDRGKVCQVNNIAFTPDGRYLLTSTYRLWEVATGKLVRTFSGEPADVNDATEVAMGSDGRQAVTLSDSQVTMWELSSGKKLWSVAIDPRSNGRMLAYSTDGRFVVTTRGGSQSRIQVYDANSGQSLQTVDVPAGITSLAISRDSQRMLSAHAGGTISVWEIAEPAVASRR